MRAQVVYVGRRRIDGGVRARDVDDDPIFGVTVLHSLEEEMAFSGSCSSSCEICE